MNDTGGERNVGRVATSSGHRALLDGHTIEVITSGEIHRLNRLMGGAGRMRLRRLPTVLSDR